MLIDDEPFDVEALRLRVVFHEKLERVGILFCMELALLMSVHEDRSSLHTNLYPHRKNNSNKLATLQDSCSG